MGAERRLTRRARSRRTRNDVSAPHAEHGTNYERKQTKDSELAVTKRADRRGVPDRTATGGATSAKREDAAQCARLWGLHQVCQDRQEHPVSVVGCARIRAGQLAALDERRKKRRKLNRRDESRCRWRPFYLSRLTSSKLCRGKVCG